MPDYTEQNRRRVSSAVFRINHFLNHLQRISSSEFPYEDAKWALKEITNHFQNLLQDSHNRDVEKSSPTNINDWCEEVRRLTESMTIVLGIIVRSRNLRNNFEIYYPLKSIAQRLINEDARLLISSEWDFVPFTYPMNIDEVPNLILFGSPATEAQNLLITPLAGHEIGHSIWQNQDLDSFFSDHVSNTVDDFEKLGKAEALKKLMREAGQDDILLGELLRASVERKLEEVFCDLVGLRLFEEAFVYAFEYFMIPGSISEFDQYPSDLTRAKLLKQSSAYLKDFVEQSVFENWSNTKQDSLFDRINNQADQLLFDLTESLEIKLDEIFSEKDYFPPCRDRISRIEKQLLNYEPFQEGAQLTEIVIALWRVAKDKDLRQKDDLEKVHDYTEISLKSIEVSEFENLVGELRN